VRESLVDAIGDRAVVIKRGEYALDRLEQVLQAVHVQIGFLLPGKRSVGQVLGGRRGAHGEGRAIPRSRRQLAVRLVDLPLQAGGERLRDDPAADLLSRFGERGDIADIEVGETLRYPPGESVLRQEVAVSLRRRGKATRHAHAGTAQLADHFAQRRVLAADRRDIAHAQCRKILNQWNIAHPGNL
jgi:hypothetical protein